MIVLLVNSSDGKTNVIIALKPSHHTSSWSITRPKIGHLHACRPTTSEAISTSRFTQQVGTFFTLFQNTTLPLPAEAKHVLDCPGPKAILTSFPSESRRYQTGPEKFSKVGGPRKPVYLVPPFPPSRYKSFMPCCLPLLLLPSSTFTASSLCNSHLAGSRDRS